MRVTASVHVGDDTEIKAHHYLTEKPDGSFDVRGYIDIDKNVALFVTRNSVAQIAKAAAQIMKQMDGAERAVEDVAV